MTLVEGKDERARSGWGVWAALAVVVLVAGVLRWVGFARFPPGLWYDEAFTLVSAQRLAQGGPFRFYYPEKHGEPGIIWLSALALKLGAGHLAPRWVTSVFSVAGVMLLFFAVRDVMRAEGRAVADQLALLSAGLLGINYAYLFYSRMSWQTLLVAVLGIPVVWGMGRVASKVKSQESAPRVGAVKSQKTRVKSQPHVWGQSKVGSTEGGGRASRVENSGVGDGKRKTEDDGRGATGAGWGWFAMAGAAAGACQYMSVSARVLPVAAGLVVVGFLLSRDGRRRLAAAWRGLAVMAVAALVVFAPLAVVFVRHPDWFGRRMGTAVPDGTSLLTSVWRTLGGWWWLGGAGLHSLPGRAIYDPVMGFVLLAGLAVAVWRITKPRYALWPAWWLGMAAGGYLSSPAPMFYRMLPAVPAASVLCALGLRAIWRAVAARDPDRERLNRVLASILVIVAVAISLDATVQDYFVRWGGWERLDYVMDVGKWQAAAVILAPPPEEDVFITMPAQLEPAVAYAANARTPPPRDFDGQRCLVYPAVATRPTHYIVVLGYEMRTLDLLRTLAPDGDLAIPDWGNTPSPLGDRQIPGRMERGVGWLRAADLAILDRRGAQEGGEQPYFVRYTLEAGCATRVEGALATPVAYGPLRLVGARMAVDGDELTGSLRPGTSLDVALTWEAVGTVAQDATVFVHLLDPAATAAADALVAQQDGVPCVGTAPTSSWRPGERVLDVHTLVVPEGTPPGTYALGVGLYDPATMVRLEHDAAAVVWDAPVIEMVVIAW